jgi:hypothetical protein
VGILFWKNGSDPTESIKSSEEPVTSVVKSVQIETKEHAFSIAWPKTSGEDGSLGNSPCDFEFEAKIDADKDKAFLVWGGQLAEAANINGGSTTFVSL